MFVEKCKKILGSEKGYGTVEVIVLMIVVAVIGTAVVTAMKPAMVNLHNRSKAGITDITGSGF